MDPDAALAWAAVLIICAASVALIMALTPEEGAKKRKPPWG
jgi:hypothetical protein